MLDKTFTAICYFAFFFGLFVKYAVFFLIKRYDNQISREYDSALNLFRNVVYMYIFFFPELCQELKSWSLALQGLQPGTCIRLTIHNTDHLVIITNIY